MLLKIITYVLALFNMAFFGGLGIWYWVHSEFPPPLIEDMKKTEAGTKIFEQMWGGPELGVRAIAGMYVVIAASGPALIAAPRWARSHQRSPSPFTQCGDDLSRGTLA